MDFATNGGDEKIDIMTFMKSMQRSMETIGMEIKASNGELGREIRECRAELKGEITNLHKKIDVEIEGVKRGTDSIRRDLTEVSKESKERMRRMEERMKQMEIGGDYLENQKRKREEMEKAVTKNPERNQPTGSTYSEIVSNSADTVKKDETKVEEVVTEQVYKSTWARQMSQVSLENQLKIATDAANRLEGEEGGRESEFRRHERNNKGKKLKLGDSTELHSNEDWPWEMSEGDWDGTADRQARNATKKRQEKERRDKKREKAIRVGKCTIGVGPIKERSYDYFNNITADYSEAKKMAAAKFLMEYLKFNHQDMSDINITDTKISGKKR